MLQKFVFIVALVSFLSVAHAANNNQPLTGSDLRQATEMNNVYARHMYSSTCIQIQKAHTPIGSDTVEQQAAKAVEFKNTCDCVTNAILEKVAPNDVINYVTYSNGELPPGVTENAKLPKQIDEKYAQIEAIEREIRTSNKCGFKKQ